MRRVGGRGGMPVSRADERMQRGFAIGIALMIACSGVNGCDQFDPPAAEPAKVESAADQARGAAREALTSTMKAAQAVTATCAAGDMRWEADPSGFAVPRHFSRPC